MKRAATAWADRGSMLPLFVGLAAISGVLSLGLAEVCSSYVYRESVQVVADQVALVAAAKALSTADQAAIELNRISTTLQITEYRLGAGQTAEVKVCGKWQGWVKLPGLNRQSAVCATSAAR